MIIQFEGVIGDFKKKDMRDDNLSLVLRHGAVEGLKELLKNFQVALYTFLSEKTIRMVIEHLFHEEEI